MNSLDIVSKWFLLVTMAAFVIALNVVLIRVVNDFAGRL